MHDPVFAQSGGGGSDGSHPKKGLRRVGRWRSAAWPTRCPGRGPSPDARGYPGSVRKRLVIGALALGLIVVGPGTAVVRETQKDARGRCEASMPSFPARVLAVDVDWRVRDFGYTCAYTLRFGARLEMPRCPAHHYRPNATRTCVPGSR